MSQNRRSWNFKNRGRDGDRPPIDRRFSNRNSNNWINTRRQWPINNRFEDRRNEPVPPPLMTVNTSESFNADTDRNMVTNTSPWSAVQTGGGGNNATWFNRNNQQISPTFIQSPNNILNTTQTTTFITTKPINNQQTTILRPIQAKRISPQGQPVTLLTVVQPHQQKSPVVQNKPPLAPKPPQSSENSGSSQNQSESTVVQSGAKENNTNNKSSDKSDISSRVELFGANNNVTTTKNQSEESVFKVPEAKTDQSVTNKRPQVKSNNVNAKNITISLEKKAEEVTNKALKNISKMDIDRLKQIINKPNIEYERVLQNVATKRIRSRMQEKLRNFKLTETNEPVVEPDECIDAEKIPDAFLSEIDRVLDLNMFDNTSESDSDVICVNDKEDSDVLDQNLGLSNEPPDRIINPEDIFLRAEILLMGDTSMLEPRSNDCSVASTRNTTPVDDMMTHIDDSLYKSEPEIVSIDDDESQDVKNVSSSGGQKPEINFVSVNEMPTLDIPLPEPNPLPETIPIPVEKQPLRRSPGESPIKFKLQPTKRFDKVSLAVSPAAISVVKTDNVLRKMSPLPEVPQPKTKSKSRSKERIQSTRSSSRTPSPRRSRTPSRDRSPYRDRSYKERRRSRHRNDREERRDKYYDREERRERKKKRRERREQREELYYSRNEHHRYRSPTPESRNYRTPSPDSIPSSKESTAEYSAERPKLDLKSKLMNLDAIKSGAIFNVKPKEPSKTESLKNYRHIREKSRSESNSPPQECSSYTPPHIPSNSSTQSCNLTTPSHSTYRDTSVEYSESHYQTKRKKKRKRRSRTKSPTSDPGTPPLTIAVTAPTDVVQDTESNEKQILQISPKLKVEIKVLSTKTPEPEIRANTKPSTVDFNQDIENELVATAVINQKTFEQNVVSNNEKCNVENKPNQQNTVIETTTEVPEQTEESVIMIAPHPVQHEPVQEEQQIVTVCQNQQLYNMITVTEASKLQAMQNVIAQQSHVSHLDTLADGLLDDIVEMEQGPSKEAAQTYEAIAQNLIEEVVKHSPPNQSQSTNLNPFGDNGNLINSDLMQQQQQQQNTNNHFSPPQNIQSSVYQSPVAQISYHSSPTTSLIHMSPASQFHQSPAHSIHSMHSIYSPASCHAYPNQSPMQNIAISPRQTLQIVPENPLSNVSMHSNHDQMSQNTYLMIDNTGHDDTLHLSPEQVQQVASLHNTPLHNADGTEKQDGNLMDEIVRNLMLSNEVVDVQTSSVMNQFSSCVQETNNTSNTYETENINSASGSPKNYTSPIRNDVFLHQPNMVQDQEGLQNLRQSVQITQSSVNNMSNTQQEPMELERFSPERLSEQFADIPMENGNINRTMNDQPHTPFSYQSEMSNDNHQQQQQRSWRSPGEKKCMTESSPARNEAEILHEKMNHVTDESQVGHVPLTSFGSAPQPSPRDNEQWVDGRINLQLLQRMKEIDIKMMSLQKEKMSIDSMILKLQTEKMEIDQTTLRLQNERFILLNTIMNAYPSMMVQQTPMIESLANSHIGQNNIQRASESDQQINQLKMSPSSQKILTESVQAVESVKQVEEVRTEKHKNNSSKSRNDSSSQQKEKHKSRKRSKSREKSSSHKSSKDSKEKERKSEKRRSEHESRSHEKKHESEKHSEKHSTPQREKSKEMVKEKPNDDNKRSSSANSSNTQPVSLPDAPIKKTVISSKIQTPTPKPPIEVPKTITIAMTTPSNVQIKTTIAKLPASIKTKVKHSFEEALSASMSPKHPSVGKKIKELKKEIPRKGMPITPVSEVKTVDPITLKITDVRTMVPTVEKPITIEKAPKTKRRMKANSDNPPKRRRKQETKRAPRKRRDKSNEQPKRPRRTGKIMQMMLPDTSDSESDRPESPIVVNEPVLSEDNDECIYLPDDFILAANEEYEEEYNNSVAHQMSLLNKECKIVLKKIDMERYLRKKPVDTKVESGLIISLPNSPDKTPSPTGVTSAVDPLLNMDGETTEDIEMEEPGSPVEEDFEGVPEPPVWDGKFQGHDSPIVHLKVVGRYLIAASEDGAIYRYLWRTGKLEKVFREHTKVATHFMVDENQFVYSVSLDGYMKKFALENFTTSVESVHLSDLLQTIELSWNNAYIGTRNGRILVYNTQMNKLLIPPLCEINKPVNIIKANKEGPRKILMVGLKGNQIQIRDADNGLLLRSLCLTEKYTIYSLALDGGVIHCGTNSNEIVTLDFHTGHEITRRKCGSGAISMKIYRNLLFTGCYDGFIYVHRKDSNKVLGKLHGPGKMLLDFELVDNKIIAAVKDKNVRIWDIAQDVLTQADNLSHTSMLTS